MSKRPPSTQELNQAYIALVEHCDECGICDRGWIESTPRSARVPEPICSTGTRLFRDFEESFSRLRQARF